MDWRVIPDRRTLNDIMRDALAKGGVASVNHAEAPEGENCMGCRWEAPAGTDMGLFQAVEVINGGVMMFSSAKYWDGQLSEGHRLAAIGGSDNHDATVPPGQAGAIGWPTTAVEAEELTVPAILNGIRAGRTFVDLTASRDNTLDFEAESGGATARMGEILKVKEGGAVHVKIHVTAARGSTTYLRLDGEELSATPAMILDSVDSTVSTQVKVGPGRHWLRLEVRDGSGTNELMSSPLYINFPEK